ncbi:hypothetical protein AMTR_s00679p00010040, partial [Amborella trichopoda]
YAILGRDLISSVLKICAIGETMFHFQDKVPPFNYVARVASNMRVRKPFTVQACFMYSIIGSVVSIIGCLQFELAN